MTRFVLDASVFVAALVPSEIHHATALGVITAGAPRQAFVVPSIFELEVVAALARRGAPDAVIEGARAAIGTGQFEIRPFDGLLDQAIAVASTARLRAYDAVYCALALATGLPFATLDVELAQRFVKHYPDARVVG